MSLERIYETSLWKKTLAEVSTDAHKVQRECLRSSFLSMRSRVEDIVNRISSQLPGLTLHDITHLDALWEVASLIIGDDYPITPLEGYILGCTFLLHDSGICIDVYERGKDGLRSTIQWRDYFIQIKESNKSLTEDEIKNHTDFAALRELHAVKAEELLNQSWTNADDQSQIFLLDSYELRKHLGKLIGQIAASHNWDIEKVESVFANQLNSINGYPREWRIDPFKLACILRCADAAHLDRERAPDFLYALLKRNGVSLNHWKAQNRLAMVDSDQSDINGETLLFTSTIDFNDNDTSAWYVAYDAISLVQKELNACNSLLEKKTNSLPFKMKKIKGIESPEEMSKYVKAINWQPCSAKIHIGNIENLISVGICCMGQIPIILEQLCAS